MIGGVPTGVIEERDPEKRRAALQKLSLAEKGGRFLLFVLGF